MSPSEGDVDVLEAARDVSRPGRSLVAAAPSLSQPSKIEFFRRRCAMKRADSASASAALLLAATPHCSVGVKEVEWCSLVYSTDVEIMERFCPLMLVRSAESVVKPVPRQHEPAIVAPIALATIATETGQNGPA